MPTAGTKFTKENDYTLNVETESFNNANHSRTLTRIFNFKAAQVTTLSREWMSFSAGVTATHAMNIQNFSDIESKEEIREMREKLIELEGQPPEINDAASSLPKARKALAP